VHLVGRHGQVDTLDDLGAVFGQRDVEVFQFEERHYRLSRLEGSGYARNGRPDSASIVAVPLFPAPFGYA